jgi:chromosome segregation ATPase
MVKQFNEYNKLIKDQNKTHEIDIRHLIATSKKIQDDCKLIEDQIATAVTFADEIDQTLNDILKPTIPDIRKKFTAKNQMIDECDEEFDRVNQQIEKMEADVDDGIKKADETIQKLQELIPLINEDDPDAQAKKEKLFELLGKAKQRREDLEKKKDLIMTVKDQIINTVEPLNELGEREVCNSDIEDIIKTLKEKEKLLDGE